VLGVWDADSCTSASLHRLHRYIYRLQYSTVPYRIASPDRWRSGSPLICVHIPLYKQLSHLQHESTCPIEPWCARLPFPSPGSAGTPSCGRPAHDRSTRSTAKRQCNLQSIPGNQLNIQKDRALPSVSPCALRRAREARSEEGSLRVGAWPARQLPITVRPSSTTGPLTGWIGSQILSFWVSDAANFTELVQ
jgi:hypothetical protein